MSVLISWFGFPNGSVLTNLIASGLAASFTVWRISKRLKNHHDLYRRLDDRLAGLLPGGEKPHLHHHHDEEAPDAER